MFFGNIIDNVGRTQKTILVVLDLVTVFSLIIYGVYSFFAGELDFDIT